MAGYSGRVPTLPGSRRPPPAGARCDDHADRLATARVQGETDSMGAEFHDLCDECFARMRSEAAAGLQGVCDWCGLAADDLRHRRDFDEGSCGPVYRVCGRCRAAEVEALRDEYD